MKKPEIPESVRTFFTTLVPPEDMPEDFIYAGTNNERQFSLFGWETKIKGEQNEVKGLSADLAEYHTFVSVKEVVLFILSSSPRGSNLLSSERKLIEAYAAHRKFDVNVPKVRKKPKGPHKKMVKAAPETSTEESAVTPVELEKKISNLHVHRWIMLSLETEHTLRSFIDEKKIVVGPGLTKFVLIDSPLEHEVGVQWLVFDNLSEGIFGKPVSTWQMILGYDPLA